MKKKIEKLYIEGINNDVAPNVFAEQVLNLFIVSNPFFCRAEETARLDPCDKQCKHCEYCDDCGDYVGDGCDNKDCKDYKDK